MLTLYNLAFIAPLVAILVILLVFGDRADRPLEGFRSWLQRRWPLVLAGLLLLVGGVLVILGGVGLLSD